MEFVVAGVPLSLQASGASRAAWKERVKESSYSGLPEQHVLFEGAVEVSIFHFPTSEMTGDVDNIVKPILDALNRHIYVDDQQVVRVVVQKIEPGQPVVFDNPSEVLTSALAGSPPFTYIRISDDPYGVVL